MQQKVQRESESAFVLARENARLLFKVCVTTDFRNGGLQPAIRQPTDFQFGGDPPRGADVTTLGVKEPGDLTQIEGNTELHISTALRENWPEEKTFR